MVTFKLGTTALGTATLNGGTAMVSTAKLTGTLTIPATDNGHAKPAKSSGTVSQTVQ